MELKEELINFYKENDQLYESIYKIIDNYGNEIETFNSQEEVDAYNDKHENDEYTVQTVEEKPLETPSEEPKQFSLSKEVQKEIIDFYNSYYAYRESVDKRIKIVQEEEPIEYSEMVADRSRMLRKWWNDNIKLLSPEAHSFINQKIKEKRAQKAKLKESLIGNYHYNQPLLNEAQKEDFTFYKTLLEATFNPNVKSSWITQIWFEPNDDELQEQEDEEGNIITVNEHNPNLKGTVFMRVKNSKTGKVYPTYEFYNVPRKVYIMWRRARSKGKYFWRRMKYNYEG